MDDRGSPLWVVRCALTNDHLALRVLYVENVLVFRKREFEQHIRNPQTRIYSLAERDDPDRDLWSGGDFSEVVQLAASHVRIAYYAANDSFVQDEMQARRLFPFEQLLALRPELGELVDLTGV